MLCEKGMTIIKVSALLIPQSTKQAIPIKT
jgi:hypothetical protein